MTDRLVLDLGTNELACIGPGCRWTCIHWAYVLMDLHALSLHGLGLHADRCVGVGLGGWVNGYESMCG